MDKPVHALLRPPGSTQRCQTGRRLHAAVVRGWQNRCSWRCIDVYTLFFGFVDRVLICCRPSGCWLWITHMPPKLGEWDHESGYFSIRTVKDLDLMWEIRQQSQKLCRLRSQRGSNKNESVCLCVVCACHQKTLRESPSVTHSVWGDLGLNQQYVWPSRYKNWTQHGSACLA